MPRYYFSMLVMFPDLLYVAGGVQLDTMETKGAGNEPFTMSSFMPITAWFHTLHRLDSNTMLMTNWQHQSLTVYQFDLASETWSIFADMITARVRAAAGIEIKY